jgi:hypothetical protein
MLWTSQVSFSYPLIVYFKLYYRKTLKQKQVEALKNCCCKFCSNQYAKAFDNREKPF